MYTALLSRVKHCHALYFLINTRLLHRTEFLRLEFNVLIPWSIIATPLWASMVGEICDIICRLRLQWYTSALSLRQQLMLASDITTITCLAVALLTVTLRLSGCIPATMPWMVVLTPLWILALVATLLCCVTPAREDVSIGEVDTSGSVLWAIGAANTIVCGVQPMLIALKVM